MTASASGKTIEKNKKNLLEEPKVKKVFKVLALVLALSMVVAFAACGGTTEETTAPADETTTGEAAELDLSKIKIGFICLHDENSTYDKNFLEAAK